MLFQKWWRGTPPSRDKKRLSRYRIWIRPKEEYHQIKQLSSFWPTANQQFRPPLSLGPSLDHRYGQDYGLVWPWTLMWFEIGWSSLTTKPTQFYQCYLHQQSLNHHWTTATYFWPSYGEVKHITSFGSVWHYWIIVLTVRTSSYSLSCDSRELHESCDRL